MKKFLLGTVGLLALGMAAPASAADMAVKARPAARCWPRFTTGPASTSAATAAGVRAATAGISLMRLAFDVADGCRERSGGLIGGQIGYRWQASQWVFGLEAQGDWADLSNQRISLDQSCCSPRAPRPMVSASLPARSATPGTQRCST